MRNESWIRENIVYILQQHTNEAEEEAGFIADDILDFFE